jgi:hypothetical protein
MGYQNANLVAVWHGDLPGASFKALIRMALSSRDADDPPRYHGGPGPLLLALGRHEVEPDDATDEARRMREANEEALRAAIQPLRKRGLVTYAVTPVRGRAPEYWLYLDPSKGQANPGGRARETLAPKASKGQANPGGRARETLAPEMKDQMSRPEEEKTNSTSVSTSPGAQDHYAAAHDRLSALPDLGASLLAQVPDGPLRERVIAAAHLAPPTPTRETA